MTQLRERMLEELQRRNYSPATSRGYILAVEQFAKYFGKSPALMGAEEVRRFQLYLLKEKKLAASTVEMRTSALRFLYKKVLRRADLELDDLPLPKSARKLSTILGPSEVRRLIEAALSPMHRAILMVLYGTGMRRAEAAVLKVADIDSERMLVHIREGKGRRDRDVPLSRNLLEALRQYWVLKKARGLSVSQQCGTPRHGCSDLGQGCLACGSSGSPACRFDPEGRSTHATAQLCHPPIRVRDRPAHDPALDGTQSAQRYHTLPATVPASSPDGQQSAGSVIS